MIRLGLSVVFSFLLILNTGCDSSKGGSGVNRANLIVESSFEGKDPFVDWSNTQHCCDYSLTQNNDKSTEGNSSVRMELRRTDPMVSSSIRTELVAVDNTSVGTERWYGMNIFLEDWDNDEAGESIFQWHPDSSHGTATATLLTSDDRYTFVTNDGLLGDDSPNIYTDLGPILNNQWVSWVIHVKWTSDTTGILQVWKNGELVIDKSNFATSPTEGVYFKLGMNKFGWGIQPSMADKRVFYYDEVRIGNEHATYEDVAPSKP